MSEPPPPPMVKKPSAAFMDRFKRSKTKSKMSLDDKQAAELEKVQKEEAAAATKAAEEKAATDKAAEEKAAADKAAGEKAAADKAKTMAEEAAKAKAEAEAAKKEAEAAAKAKAKAKAEAEAAAAKAKSPERALSPISPEILKDKESPMAAEKKDNSFDALLDGLATRANRAISEATAYVTGVKEEPKEYVPSLPLEELPLWQRRQLAAKDTAASAAALSAAVGALLQLLLLPLLLFVGVKVAAMGAVALTEAGYGVQMFASVLEAEIFVDAAAANATQIAEAMAADLKAFAGVSPPPLPSTPGPWWKFGKN